MTKHTTKISRFSEQGFTLIELLIVVAILGILAAIIIPNAAGFMITGTINAANTEASSVKTAAMGYMAENNGTWPDDSGDLDDYYTGDLKADYTFSTVAGEGGLISEAEPKSDIGWSGITWNAETQMWERD